VTGLNDATLLGAVTGFQAFSVIGNGNTTFYTISDQSGGNFEVGIGTYSSIGPTLERTTVLTSSNSNAKVSFPAGTKDVFITYPSEKAVYLDASGDVQPALGTVNATTVDTTNLEVTNLKAKDGTAAGSIANSTGVVTLASSVLTTTDINGGTIDGTTIGGASAAAGNFTTLGASSTATLNTLASSGATLTGGSINGMAIGGSTAAAGNFTTLGATGVATFSAGTVSSPAITTTGDTNTGIFFPAADTIAFSEGGVESMRLDSDGQVIISANNTTNGLRITQVGTGNALLVEDSANPDSSPFVIDATGRVVVGNTVSIDANDTVGASGIQVNSGAQGAAGISSVRWSNSASSQSIVLGKSRNSTIGTQTIVQSGDSIGRLLWRASDGVDFISAAQIDALVDGTPGTNDMPGRLVFSTTADGASSPTERMRIDSSGRVLIGSSGTSVASSGSLEFSLQVSGLDASSSGASFNRFQNSAGAATSIRLGKSRGTTVGAYDVVSSGDDLAIIDFVGSDGTGFVPAARIIARVDGTPGVNDMPGRLLFLTTADGASSSTERMRIDSAGDVKINSAIANPIGKFSVRQPTTFDNSSGTAAAPTAAINIVSQGSQTGGALFGGLTWARSSSNGGTSSAAIAAVAETTAATGLRFFVGSNANTQALDLSSTGGVSISRTAVTSPAASDGNVFSGTYTPTLTNSTNVASSTASILQYMRVGSVVTVSGLVAITPTAGSDASTILEMSLPISSDFAATTNLGGTGVISSATGRGVAAAIYADTTTDKAEFSFLSPAASTVSMRFTFTYRII
jgi:hypothetical protein